jgi:hypothetical protein
MLLLLLVSSSIVWPAAASSPLCTMACCAGKTPHAAGSCVHSACETGISTDTPKASSHEHSHHHDSQKAVAPDSKGEESLILAGVTGGACGADMEEVPTIEAAPVQADEELPNTAERKTDQAFSATVVSQPCEAGCGACTSSFAAPNRSRNALALSGVKNPPVPHSSKYADHNRPLTFAASMICRESVPRGPPAAFA